MVPALIIFFLFACIFCFVVFKNILNPPFLLSAVWLFVFSFYLNAPFYDANPSYYYLIFPVGHLLFIFGFLLKPSRNMTQKSHTNNKLEFNVNFTMFRVIILMQTVIFLMTLSKAMVAIKSNFHSNWWYTLKWLTAVGEYENGIIFEYTRVFSFVVCYVLAGLFFLTNDKQIKKLFIFQFLNAALFAILSLGRTFLFQLFIPTVFIYLLMNIKDNKLAIKVLIRFLITSLVIFFSINSLKYLNSSSGVMDSFYLYFTGSIKGFVDWAETFNEFGHGQNTFRFFLTFLSEVGYGIESKGILEGFIDIGNGFSTNVYSIYKWYFSDFGTWYALLIPFILGIMYRNLYENLFTEKNITKIIILSIAYYPLLMQFFQDQYLSLTSTWIQTAFWLYLILHSGIFIKKGKINDNSRYGNSKLECRSSNKRLSRFN